MDCFHETYPDCVTAFREAAEHAGARQARYLRDDVAGADGEPLSVDLALLGEESADRVALVLSGLHGAEAYAGSAVQIAWLGTHGRAPLPAGVRLVLVHGVNPWGFSQMLRTTEKNIDLNRNFRSSWPGPDNGAYDALAPFLHGSRFDAADDLRAWRDYKAYLDRHGWDVEGRAISGQAQSPDGLFYCGDAPDWANLTFRRLIRDHLTGATRAGFIDLHTGIGEFGEIVHLIFAPDGSEERAQARSWWGLGDDGRAGFRAGIVPPYEGLACNAVAQELSGARIAGAVVEFGVCDAYALFRGDRLDRWLRTDGRADPDHAALRRLSRDTFTPRDPSWRRLVIREGTARIDQLLRGLAQWR